MQALVEPWIMFWFPAGDAFNLGVARAIIVGYFLLFKLSEKGFDLAAWARAFEIFKDMWQRPWLVKVLRLNIEPGRAHRLLIWIYKVALVFSAVGFFSRTSCLVAFGLGIYLLALRHGIRTHHTVIPIHFCLLILAIAPSGDAFSIDRLMAGRPPAQPMPELYGWAMQSMKVVIAFLIFGSGTAKVKYIFAGHNFWERGHLADLLRLHDFPFFFVRPVLSASGLLRKYRFIECPAAIGTVILEFIYPVVLFVPATEYFLVGSFVLMLVGFRFFIGARFDFISVTLLALYVPWREISAL